MASAAILRFTSLTCPRFPLDSDEEDEDEEENEDEDEDEEDDEYKFVTDSYRKGVNEEQVEEEEVVMVDRGGAVGGGGGGAVTVIVMDAGYGCPSSPSPEDDDNDDHVNDGLSSSSSSSSSSPSLLSLEAKVRAAETAKIVVLGPRLKAAVTNERFTVGMANGSCQQYCHRGNDNNDDDGTKEAKRCGGVATLSSSLLLAVPCSPLSPSHRATGMSDAPDAAASLEDDKELYTARKEDNREKDEVGEDGDGNGNGIGNGEGGKEARYLEATATASHVSPLSLTPLTMLPPPPMQQLLPPGLVNLGNTCYLNAATQMLASVNGFVQDVSDFVGRDDVGRGGGGGGGDNGNDVNDDVHAARIVVGNDLGVRLHPESSLSLLSSSSLSSSSSPPQWRQTVEGAMSGNGDDETVCGTAAENRGHGWGVRPEIAAKSDRATITTMTTTAMMMTTTAKVPELAKEKASSMATKREDATTKAEAEVEVEAKKQPLGRTLSNVFSRLQNPTPVASSFPTDNDHVKWTRCHAGAAVGSSSNESTASANHDNNNNDNDNGAIMNHCPRPSEPVNPSDLKEAIDRATTLFAGYDQQDGHEFIGALLDLLHDEMTEAAMAKAKDVVAKAETLTFITTTTDEAEVKHALPLFNSTVAEEISREVQVAAASKIVERCIDLKDEILPPSRTTMEAIGSDGSECVDVVGTTTVAAASSSLALSVSTDDATFGLVSNHFVGAKGSGDGEEEDSAATAKTTEGGGEWELVPTTTAIDSFDSAFEDVTDAKETIVTMVEKGENEHIDVHESPLSDDERAHNLQDDDDENADDEDDEEEDAVMVAVVAPPLPLSQKCVGETEEAGGTECQGVGGCHNQGKDAGCSAEARSVIMQLARLLGGRAAVPSAPLALATTTSPPPLTTTMISLSSPDRHDDDDDDDDGTEEKGRNIEDENFVVVPRPNVVVDAAAAAVEHCCHLPASGWAVTAAPAATAAVDAAVGRNGVAASESDEDSSASGHSENVGDDNDDDDNDNGNDGKIAAICPTESSIETAATSVSESAKGATPTGRTPVDEHFTVEVRSHLTCDACGAARERTETYRHLSLEVTSSSSVSDGICVGGGSSVAQGLRRFFAPETVEVACEEDGCNGTTARRTSEIARLPRALLLHFKRFIVDISPDYTRISYRKDHSPVYFAKNMSLSGMLDGGDEKDLAGRSGTKCKGVAAEKVEEIVSLAEFLTKDAIIPSRSRHAAIGSTNATNGNIASQGVIEIGGVCAGNTEKDVNISRAYRLRSVVHHIGSSANCGHYVADADRAGKWMRFNDALVSTKDVADVIGESSRRTAYMLLYELD